MNLLELWCIVRERVKGLFTRQQLDRDLDDEMAFHLAMRAENHAAEGLNAQEAQLAARRQFGNTVLIRETCRDAWTFGWLECLYADLRRALRLLGQNPGFTAAAVLSLALGIGANTTMFSVVRTIFIKPLPWNDAGRVVRMSLREKGDEKFQYRIYPSDRRVFEAWRNGCTLYSNIAADSMEVTGVSLTGSSKAEHYNARMVSSNFFELLGTAPAIGRTFFTEEDQAGRANVAVLSHTLWKERFEGNPAITGQTLMPNSQTHTVIGVLPADFRAPHWQLRKDVDVWLPLDPSKDPNGRFMGVFGRLKPQVTLKQAEAEASAIAGGIDPKLRCAVNPLTSDYDGTKPRLALLFAVVVLVLMAGLAAGVAGSALLTGLIRHFLYRVEPYDPGTLAGVAALLILVAGIAAWLPARRAASSDPMHALKYE